MKLDLLRCIFDLNNDYFQDLFLVGGEFPDHLYLNQGDGTFLDISRSSGIRAVNLKNSLGAVSGDFDNDGYRDLFVSTILGRPNYLLHNQGDGTFTDISLESGIQMVSGDSLESQWSFSPIVGDFNLDGYLDIYINSWIESGTGILDTAIWGQLF